MVRSVVGVGVAAPVELDVGDGELLRVGSGEAEVHPASIPTAATIAAALVNAAKRARRAPGIFGTVSTPMSLPVCSLRGPGAMPRGPATATMGIVKRAIDLNSDLGESFGAWRMGDDEAMIGLVSSANIA